ncbi:MAG: helix-turn-helix transcriptional regulator [Candidatus Lokiarchaeota archaeon]|nr:helix-turn-helix transcriptional regulator [Candidatus Lokiarchaeota archaeon]
MALTAFPYCKKAGIAQATLSRILNKRREPSLRLLQIILDALGYKISFQKNSYVEKLSLIIENKNDLD